MTTRSIRSFVLAALTAVMTLSSIAASFAQPAPVPALPDTERRTSYSLTASNCACSVVFQLYGDSTDFQNWVEVFINGVQVQYNDPVFGWTITSPSGPLANLPRPITDAVLTFNNVQTGTVQIVGARRPRRAVQFQEGAGVPARNLNQAITDMVAMLREDWDKINDVTGRAVLAPPGETLKILPAMANRLNQGACFDSGGNLTNCVAVPTSSLIQGANILLSGTNPTTISAVIPPPGVATLGGVNSKDCSSGNQAVQKLNLDGSVTCSTNAATLTEQKNTASGGLTTSGNCDNTSTNASSPCNYAMRLDSAVVEATSLANSPIANNTMMGWGTTNCKLTPTYSSRVMVEITGGLSETSGGGLTVTAHWGTGAAPANGAASAGSVIGSTVSVNGSGSTGVSAPFKIGGIITGLTPGTAIWFDGFAGASGTVSFSSLTCRAHEVL